jgi:hypothetical protein
MVRRQADRRGLTSKVAAPDGAVLADVYRIMMLVTLLGVLTQASTATVPPELTGVLERHLTASAPSAVVGCTSATKADRQLLPDAEARERRVWSCPMMCSAPIGQRDALLIERRWRQPVLFLDSNRDGTFDPSERHEFPRAGDLHLRIPISSNIFSEYPITIRYRWELFKPPGDPQRRMLLESPMVSIGGTVTIAGRPLRVEYPVSPGLWPEVTGGWFRIDADGDGRIDDDPLSEESAPPASKVPIVRVGDRYVSTVSVDAIEHVVKLREHPPSDYRRIVLRVGEQLPDFTYRDISSGASSRLSATRSGLVSAGDRGTAAHRIRFSDAGSKGTHGHRIARRLGTPDGRAGDLTLSPDLAECRP